MDEKVQEAVITAVIQRRRAAVAQLIQILRERRRRPKRNIWSREWLKRRNTGKDVLYMLFQELRVEDPQSFQNFTKMSSDVFDELLDLVSPFIEKRDTVMRQAISARERFGVTLRYLATGNTFKDLSYSTRIAPWTLSKIVDEACDAIIQVLEPRFIEFPTTPDQWKLISERFDNKWQFPHCIGALDGKHIAFHPPRMEGSKYRNYKGSDSIILMALVDADYRFIFVDVGRNGRMHDSSVFRTCPLGEKMASGTLNLPEPSTLLDYQQPMPYVIVGDDAFPLKDNLMKPYPDRNLSMDRRIFNYRLSRSRRVSENAFGIMSNRFRVLLNAMNLSVNRVETITYTCVLLHNFLLTKKCQDWYVPTICQGEDPGILRSGLEGVGRQTGNRSCHSAQDIRDHFCDYFNTAGIVTWQYDAIEKGNG